MLTVKCYPTDIKTKIVFAKFILDNHADIRSIEHGREFIVEMYNGDTFQFITIPVFVQLEKIIGIVGEINIEEVLKELHDLENGLKFYAATGKVREESRRIAEGQMLMERSNICGKEIKA